MVECFCTIKTLIKTLEFLINSLDCFPERSDRSHRTIADEIRANREQGFGLNDGGSDGPKNGGSGFLETFPDGETTATGVDLWRGTTADVFSGNFILIGEQGRVFNSII